MSTEPLVNYRHRPILRRLVDGLGGIGQRCGVGRQQFHAENLIELVCKKANLTDFGDPPVLEPLQMLCEGYEQEAHLTFAGRIAARQHLLQLLCNRLQLTRYREQNPEIKNQVIERPIFVLGLPRSGTTLLHGLLAQDPRHRTPMTWEVMYPTPPPKKKTALTDKRIKVTNKQLGWMEHLAPGFKTIHPIGALLPQECIAITAHAFISLEFHTTHNVPSYQRWFESQDLRRAYEFHRRFLQHLQWRHRLDRWVLKAPDHLRGLNALLDVYPDAIVVHTHRDPLQVTASIASSGTVIRAAFSDQINPQGIAAGWSDYWANSLHHALEIRSQAKNTQFVDVFYQKLVDDPLKTVAMLYQQLGIEFIDSAKQGMTDYLNKNPQDKHGRHRYSLDQFNLDPKSLRQNYQRYYQEFDLS